MKYVILIHSNPQPWGHPTGDYLPEYQAMSQAERDRVNSDFEKLLGELQEKSLSGRVIGCSARLCTNLRWCNCCPMGIRPARKSRRSVV